MLDFAAQNSRHWFMSDNFLHDLLGHILNSSFTWFHCSARNYCELCHELRLAV